MSVVQTWLSKEEGTVAAQLPVVLPGQLCINCLGFIPCCSVAARVSVWSQIRKGVAVQDGLDIERQVLNEPRVVDV